MASPSPPVEVGVRGTIASLVSKEIEYFKMLDLKSKTRNADEASSSGTSKNNLNSCVAVKNKKKKVAGSGLIPSICSVVEINNAAIRVNRSAGIDYKNLDNVKKLPQD